MAPTPNSEAAVIDTVVAPAVASALVVVALVSSYALAVAQIETPTELPCVQAVLAAHSPLEPCPVEKDSE